MTKNFFYQGTDQLKKSLIPGLEAAGYKRVEFVEEAQIVLTHCLSLTALEDAYFDEEGILQAAAPGTLLIDLSPSTPSFARELSAIAAVSELVAVEAPLALHDLTLRDAFSVKENLFCFVSGEEGALDQATPLLELFVGSLHVAGGSGSAQLARCSHTLQFASQVISAVESDALYKAVLGSPVAPVACKGHIFDFSPSVSRLTLASIEANSFVGDYTVEMFMGELSAALTAADDADLILPQAEACLHLLELLAVIGGAAKSPSALSLVYGDEKSCAEEGLDWSLAQEAYGAYGSGVDLEDFGLEDYDEADFSLTCEPGHECGCGDDSPGEDSYPGFLGYPGYSAN